MRQEGLRLLGTLPEMAGFSEGLLVHEPLRASVLSFADIICGSSEQAHTDMHLAMSAWTPTP